MTTKVMQFYPKSALSVKLFMFIFNYFYPDKLLYLSGIKKTGPFDPVSIEICWFPIMQGMQEGYLQQLHCR